ncbi:hypothetical protein Tco_0686872 [Tanacetum coccineum]
MMKSGFPLRKESRSVPPISSSTLLRRSRVQTPTKEDFTDVPDDESTLTFLIDLGYKGKGLQGKKTADTSKATVDVSEESDSKPARKQTSHRRVIKKNVSIYADNNIIPKPYVSLELGKSISLTKAAEEEAARQVHATHERIMTESDPEPARRIPSGIAFRDTSRVSKKISPDPS